MDKQTPTPRLDLEKFQLATSAMIAKNRGSYGARRPWQNQRVNYDYTIEDVEIIISGGNLYSQQDLSREFFDNGSFYRQVIVHYATLLKNIGILIPNPMSGVSLQDSPIEKRLNGALNYIERMKLNELLAHFSLNTLVDGTYYGVIKELTRANFHIIDLPFQYCRTRYQNKDGEDLVEFNVQFFSKILDDEERNRVLKTFPKSFSEAYRLWENGRGDNWFTIPDDISVSFQLFKASPYFLFFIPALLQYNDSVTKEAERATEEIRKILVNQIPHLSDGKLLFESEEALLMHEGLVDMLGENNPNMSVVTTYGEVDVVQSKTTDSVTHTALDQALKHVYSSAGVSPLIFAADTSSSIGTSLKYDTAVMMILGNQYGSFVTKIINRLYGNTQIQFKYTLLPITYYNEQEFIQDSFKLAQSGYSLLLPALAQGINQKDLMNIKTLENEYLKLNEKLIPLQSAYTQSGDKGGRPQLPDDKVDDETIRTKESKEKGG